MFRIYFRDWKKTCQTNRKFKFIMSATSQLNNLQLIKITREHVVVKAANALYVTDFDYS